MGRVDEPGYGRRGQYRPRGDYGPGAFNPGGSRTRNSSAPDLADSAPRGADQPALIARAATSTRATSGTTRRANTPEKDPRATADPTIGSAKKYATILTRHGTDRRLRDRGAGQDGEVTLAGTVQRREEKRMAEDVAERVSASAMCTINCEPPQELRRTPFGTTGAGSRKSGAKPAGHGVFPLRAGPP